MRPTRPPERFRMRGGRDTRSHRRMRLDGLWLIAKGTAGIALVIVGCVFVIHAIEAAVGLR